jgi:hypothetical protein
MYSTHGTGIWTPSDGLCVVNIVVGLISAVDVLVRRPSSCESESEEKVEEEEEWNPNSSPITEFFLF